MYVTTGGREVSFTLKIKVFLNKKLIIVIIYSTLFKQTHKNVLVLSVRAVTDRYEHRAAATTNTAIFAGDTF